jgi:hypothetical protein
MVSARQGALLLALGLGLAVCGAMLPGMTSGPEVGTAASVHVTGTVGRDGSTIAIDMQPGS